MFNVEYDIIDEIKIGKKGTHLRLAENIRSKKRVIQSWSSLSNQWNVMHRYNADEEWSKWKRTAHAIKSRKN